MRYTASIETMEIKVENTEMQMIDTMEMEVGVEAGRLT